MKHNDKSHGISHGSIIWIIIWKLQESDIRANCNSINGPLKTTNTGGNIQYREKHHNKWNGKTKKIQSNRHDIYWVRDRIRQNNFHIWWKEGNKNLAGYITKHHLIWNHRTMRPRYFKLAKKYTEKWKDRLTGTGTGCDGTTNPGVTRKPDNPLKGIRNPIPRKPDNLLKGIRNLVPNGIQSQCPRGLTVPT